MARYLIANTMAGDPELDLMLELHGLFQRRLNELSPEKQRALVTSLLREVPPDPAEPRKQARLTKPAPVPRPRRRVARKQAVAPAGKPPKGAVTSLAIETVLKSAQPLTAGEVLKQVRKKLPGVNPVAVYAALHSAADGEDARINQKNLSGNKAIYSKPQGGKTK